jgi:hypothetical protein
MRALLVVVATCAAALAAGDPRLNVSVSATAPDVHLGSKLRRHTATGATRIVTTALPRRLGRDGVELAGMSASSTSRARRVRAA